jgi:hypothetical protein
MRLRSATIIGHLTNRHRMNRNDLAVRHRDGTNAVVAAVAQKSDL